MHQYKSRRYWKNIYNIKKGMFNYDMHIMCVLKIYSNVTDEIVRVLKSVWMKLPDLMFSIYSYSHEMIKYFSCLSKL